jgi:hypothetical protein
VFDLNTPIDTGVVTNLLDSLPPSSRVNSLAYRGGKQFQLRWGGGDAEGSGIASYDLYVSKNGGPYQVWLRGTTATEGAYPAETGVVCRFYVQAIDGVGNRQSAPLTADVTTEDWLLAELVDRAGLELRWTSIPGSEYSIQQAAELSGATQWLAIGGPLKAEGYLSAYRLDAAPSSHAYYRIIKLR